MLEYYAIMYPSKIHAELSKLKALLCMNYNATCSADSLLNSKNSIKSLPEQNVNLAADGCNLLDRDLTDLAQRQFYEFQIVLKWSGFLSRINSSSARVQLQNLWITFMVVIGIYMMFYDLFFLLIDFQMKYASHVAISIAVICQALISLLLSTYWQRNLCFERFFHQLHHCKIRDMDTFDTGYVTTNKKIRWQFLGIQIYCTVNAVMFLMSMATNSLETVMLPSLSHSFYYRELRYIRPCIAYIFLTIINYNMHIYLCLTNVLHFEVKKFNFKLTQIVSITMTFFAFFLNIKSKDQSLPI
ncbi:unnamed protein product, partial [Mesorhabditis belari]|uniref:Uncharacterized protein n=1 Tax=Mesorhabditis belari TaxID=2138241 RepID=A0AAF3END1_9BILA